MDIVVRYSIFGYLLGEGFRNVFKNSGFEGPLDFLRSVKRYYENGTNSIYEENLDWLYSQGNNFVPPINLDKFTNFFNYYWIWRL